MVMVSVKADLLCIKSLGRFLHILGEARLVIGREEPFGVAARIRLGHIHPFDQFQLVDFPLNHAV